MCAAKNRDDSKPAGQKQAKRPRLFFALLPGEDTLEKLLSAGSRFSAKPGKSVTPENLHITLLFMGGVDPAIMNLLVQDCGGIRTEPFSLTIDRSGWWKKPQILWLGPSETPFALRSLVYQLRSLAVKHQLATGTREYFPHITLMRKVSRQPALRDFTPFTWPANEFCLMESLTRPEGVEYRELARWPL